MRSEMIVEILKRSQADAWEVKECTTKAWEFYFIRHLLDQNRTRQVVHTEVTV